ncbi:serine/threonine kinase-like domain-containing protein STKLD1 isoform X4 [Gallus gallus]|uniref:Serine/threonine kinase-like domain-containing protein STKLD1 n=1 Tax=Gallus gallus TaxID=9031 RepID=A0A8V1AAE2_CHICK|nr:serine/threonine kinase-like domain-containing protein STKLD1 isoform X4 [Gallus gallus]XP_046785173.1 serine/threonine kinase-like domain-containing protein STKLD1 isoform X4 [Gallus gallus]
MEKYEVLQRLQPGALGTVLVAGLKAERNAKDRFVIKQVECIDEKQANEALKEAMGLLQLHHSSICAYKEMFVTWDNEVLLKFLGQMVDALFYIHKQNIFHRNLKPSNILVTGETSFKLCDFGTETLMTDEWKWKIRVEENCKCWMAPEAFSFSFSDKSDIWSLGCILLDMMTCFVLNAEEITLLLQDIRRDTSHLDRVLSLMEIGENSSLPLFPVLSMMLQIQPSMRTTAKDLIDVPFIGECLIVASSSVIKQKKSLASCVIDMFLEGGIGSILEFMQAFWDVEEAQAKAMQHLAHFVGDKSALPYLLTFTELIVFALKTHTNCFKLQVDGCSLLLEVLSQALEQDVVMVLDENVINSLLEIVRRHSEDEELLSLICPLLMMISADEVVAENLRKAGLTSDLLSILCNFIHNEQICHTSCAVLWSLAVSENSVDQVMLQSAVPIITAVIQEHLQNGAVLKSACSALWALSLQGFLTENDYEPTTVLLMDALRMNLEKPMLVNNTCLALASLLRLSEIAALRFITDSKGSGINLIKDAYRFYCDDPQVVESICVLINEMVQYDDVMLDMLSQQMEELLSEIKSRFPSSMEIMTLADTALLKLQE